FLAVVCDRRVEHLEMPPMGVVAILPEIVVSTKSARSILPEQVPVREMVHNVGRAAQLVAGVAKGDPWLIGQSLADTFNERYRSPLITGYRAVRQAALEGGAYGVAISGSGPTMIALCPEEKAFDIAAAMRGRFSGAGVGSEAFVTRVGPGVQITRRG
ncbi:MAG TPA: homoserine kinase, partial [Methanocella sp.]|nr:homoserine kinase [Methanocella sp.]